MQIFSKLLFTVTALLLLGQSSFVFGKADISFIVIDLKYNQSQGVKICEIQPGSFSRFSGSDHLEGLNSIEKKYLDFIDRYYLPKFFTHPIYQKIKPLLIDRGWTSLLNLQDLGKKFGEDPPADPENLFGYKACLLSLKIDPIPKGEPQRLHQILFLDRAILPFSQNKLTMNTLLHQIPEMRKLRPVWHIYKKGSSDDLLEQISRDIPGEIVVIKPIQSTMGRGVIIEEKSKLQKILHYVFYSPKEVLLADLERSYSQYAIDHSDYFIAEEFIPSAPLYLGQDSLPYDCTMRIIAILSYHKKVPKVTYLGEYWYSPHKPLDPAFTLIQSHKAKGTYYAKVDEKTLTEVKKQLTQPLMKAYLHMLHQSDI